MNMISNPNTNTNTTTNENPEEAIEEDNEIFEVNVTLPRPFYEISRLICEMRYDLDWDSYVSDLVKQDTLNMRNDSDCGIFRDYVIRKLKNQE